MKADMPVQIHCELKQWNNAPFLCVFSYAKLYFFVILAKINLALSLRLSANFLNSLL